MDAVLQEGKYIVGIMYKVVKKYRAIMITRMMECDDCDRDNWLKKTMKCQKVTNHKLKDYMKRQLASKAASKGHLSTIESSQCV